MAAPDNRKNKPRGVARSSARLGAVQALYQMDLAATGVDVVLEQISTGRLGDVFEDGECGKADFSFLSGIVKGAVREQKTLDPVINGCLPDRWKLARLDSTVRAIMRSAAYELMFMADVPARVIISEYLDVAHAFFAGDEFRLINGALDRLARNHRKDEFSAPGKDQ